MIKLISLAFLALPFTLLADNELKVKAKPESATVYLQGAEIVSHFNTAIPGGTSIVLVQGLPVNLNQSTIQVGCTGGVTIQSTEFRLNYLDAATKTPRQKMLEDSVEIVSNQKIRLANAKQNNTDQINILLANKTVGGANTGLNVAELQKMIDYYNVKSMALRNDNIEIDMKDKKLQEQLNRLNNQLAEENTKHDQPQGEIAIQVMSRQPLSSDFSLTYMVTDAGWSPIYDLRCENVKSPLKLSYKAQVWQNTGVAWNKMKLSISTGNPNVDNTNPVLQPWYLQYVQPMIYRTKNTYSLNQTMAPAAVERMDKVEIKGARDESTKYEAGGVMEYTTVTESQLNATFDIDLAYDIPSDGKPHMVNMIDYDLPATYEYYAVPKLDKDAFLLARITDWEKLNLLAAPTNIFFEGTYVGQSNIDPQNTRDTLSFSLGRDKKVIIKRQKVTEFCSSKYIGTNKKEELMFDITVRNTKKDAINLTILDQYPISTDSNIEIELLEKSNAIEDKEKGQLKWKFNLNAAENKTLRMGYRVKYPKDKVIGGLN